MDIFKQKRYLIFVVGVLAVLNVTTLAILWLDRPTPGMMPPPAISPVQQEERIRTLLHQELGFTEAQARAYMDLRREHQDRINKLNREIHQIKRQMFDQVLQPHSEPTLSDSLLNLAQKKQALIERLTFQHFLDLKELCQPEQEQHLQKLLHEMFRKHQVHAGAPRPHQPRELH